MRILARVWLSEINGEVKPGEQAAFIALCLQRLYHLINPTKEAYRENDELTSTDIKHLLVTKWSDIIVSISTVKLACKEKKWVWSFGS